METNNIAKAMAAAFAQIDSAKKAAFNPHLKNKYADLASVVEAIKPALTQHGLFFTQRCESNEEGVTVYTTLFHASGESLDMGSLFLPVLKKDPQGYGSAITYARRYSLLCAFGVPADDDDGEAASVEYKPMPKVAPTLVKAAEEASAKGMDAYRKFWAGLNAQDRNALTKSGDHDRLKAAASTVAVDQETGEVVS